MRENGSKLFEDWFFNFINYKIYYANKNKIPHKYRSSQNDERELEMKSFVGTNGD
jgi:hypothetical protein